MDQVGSPTKKCAPLNRREVIIRLHIKLQHGQRKESKKMFIMIIDYLSQNGLTGVLKHLIHASFLLSPTSPVSDTLR